MNNREHWRTDARLIFRGIRSAILITVAILLLIYAFAAILHAQRAPSDLEPILQEHRITALETKMDNIVRDVADVRSYEWMLLIGMAALLGEKGVNLLKARPKGGE